MNRPNVETKKAAEVSGMFDTVAEKYDFTNDLLSLGIDRLWRIAAVNAVAPQPGQQILDLAAGTGTSSAALAKRGAAVTAADFSEGMLAVGRKRHADNPLLEFVWADATELPFDDNTFDAATISFGLRNVQDVAAALSEMVRVVKPGGRVVVCEFSTPIAPLRAPYNFYSSRLLPCIAGKITGNKAAYEYLNQSIESWPSQELLAVKLQQAGLERVRYRNLSGGIAALHRGFVPAKAAQKAE
ncbi:bifunctional demethylmenaquinone methyltransferase/2-methoxy-6-polyprenyl-1,4-benzoquinol methylase UbiE [Leucobacter sp. OH2974_COT-288]|nr:bifunctional demethylmenaquinone methyltransferase/2-methoxy-6-polyprenyl-1,4-benzoquinol methylase UbiE [Leucobacter sp. OH2974_COT-288]